MAMSLRDFLWKNRWRFTATEFARRLDTNPTYLSKIASGAIVPSMSLAKKIERETDGQVIWHEIMEFCHTVQEAKNDCKK